METIPKNVTAMLTETRSMIEKLEALAQNIREAREVLKNSIRGVEVDIKEINISNGYIPGCGGDYTSWKSILTVSMFKLSNERPGCNVSAIAFGELHTNDSDDGSKDISECLAIINSRKPMSAEEFIAGVKEHSMAIWLDNFSYRLFALTGREMKEINYMGRPKSD